MRIIFDALSSQGEPVLQRCCAERLSEGVQLEFKEKQNAKHGDFEKSDKRVLGRTLSAFANSAGGLLIFGAEARQIDGVDALLALHPITGLDRFTSQARTLCAEYLVPRHDGVELLAVPSGSAKERGYLAIWVERSERRPHQSKAPDDGLYYKRAGDITFAMEHYDIEDAFRRVAAPQVALESALLSQGFIRSGQVRRCEVQVELRLLNHGALGRFPFLLVEQLRHCTVDRYGIDGNMNTGLPRRPHMAGTPLFAGGADNVLHPGVPLPVMRLVVEVEGQGGRLKFSGQAPADFKASALITFGCEGTPTKSIRLEFEGQDLLQHLEQSGRLNELTN